MKEKLLFLSQKGFRIVMWLGMKGGSVNGTSLSHSGGHSRVLIIHVDMIEGGYAWPLIAWKCKLRKFEVSVYKVGVP
jgi:hypothetical protein